MPFCIVLVGVCAVTFADELFAADSESVDLRALHIIKQEGFERSQVMEVAATLTDVHGPRLTGSPTARAAGSYARETLDDWGLADARMEPWEFGSGWSNELFWARIVTPQYFQLIGYPRAWTPGTNGVARAEVMLLTAQSLDELAAYRGQLAGKIALVDPEPERPVVVVPERFSNDDLWSLSRQPVPSEARVPRLTPAAKELIAARNELLVSENVVAVLESSRRVAGGAVMVAGSGSRLETAPATPPSVILSSDHYGRVRRLLERGLPVEIEMEITNRSHQEQTDSFNVVAEIPGTERPDQIVLIGAHLDSWHAGTGATDNAAGCAVMMEAMRILRQSGLRLRRTVRIALWMGEEQGLMGSRAYVNQHLLDNGVPAASHEKFSGYFNLDAGSGAIRGVYLQGNELAAPIFAAWIKPLEDMGVTTLSIRPGGPGNSDQSAFDKAGLPAFQFIQDSIGYDNWAHHSNADTFERLSADDLVKNAIIVAAFVYHAANRDDLLPRKPKIPSH